MSKLYRPAIPIETQCRVALRQLGEMWPDKVIDEWRYSNRNKARNLSLLHARLIAQLAGLLGCEVDELRLDHDPPLGAREKIGDGKRTVYKPAANDPEHLGYRPHGAQHAGSHDVKTRIRGDHGQYSDITLIKRERRRQKRASQQKRVTEKKSKHFRSCVDKSRPKTKWAKRSFQKRRKP